MIFIVHTRLLKYRAGFTVIEMAVSIAIITLFAIMLFRVYLLMESQRMLVLRRTAASDIAYKNLRKYQTRPSTITGGSGLCDSQKMSTGQYGVTSTNGIVIGTQDNTSQNVSSFGFVAEDTTKLGAGATQSLRAYAPYGCGSQFDNLPIMIRSTVTFNSGAESVSHEAYVN